MTDAGRFDHIKDTNPAQFFYNVNDRGGESTPPFSWCCSLLAHPFIAARVQVAGDEEAVAGAVAVGADMARVAGLQAPGACCRCPTAAGHCSRPRHVRRSLAVLWMFCGRLLVVVVTERKNCWFCLASEDLEKHMIVTIGTEAYLALAKVFVAFLLSVSLSLSASVSLEACQYSGLSWLGSRICIAYPLLLSRAPALHCVFVFYAAFSCRTTSSQSSPSSTQGPCVKDHLLVLPIQHESCYAMLPPSAADELERYLPCDQSSCPSPSLVAC